MVRLPFMVRMRLPVLLILLRRKTLLVRNWRLMVAKLTYGDGTSYGVSILHGMDIAGGNLVLGAQYSERGEISQGDRDYIPDGCSSFVPEGSLGGKVPDGNGGFKPRDTCYDYTEQSYAQTPNELLSLFSSFNKEIASDTDLSVDLMYTKRDSNQQMAPQPASIDLDSDKLDDKYTDEFVDEDGNLPDSLEYRRRMVDAGPRIYEQETDTVRASIGLSGILDNDDRWDVSATYGAMILLTVYKTRFTRVTWKKAFMQIKIYGLAVMKLIEISWKVKGFCTLSIIKAVMNNLSWQRAMQGSPIAI